MKRRLIYVAAAIVLAPIALAIFCVPFLLLQRYRLPTEIGFVFWFFVCAAAIFLSPRARYFVTGE